MRLSLLIFVLTIIALNIAREAAADVTIVLQSVDGASSIELSCSAEKKPALLVKSRPRPPVLRPGDPAVGVSDAGVVQYTFDGQTPFREKWLQHEDGIAPPDEARLRAFAQRLFVGHVLHLGVGGMQVTEFQLDPESTRLREFAQACVRR